MERERERDLRMGRSSGRCGGELRLGHDGFCYPKKAPFILSLFFIDDKPFPNNGAWVLEKSTLVQIFKIINPEKCIQSRKIGEESLAGGRRAVRGPG